MESLIQNLVFNLSNVGNQNLFIYMQVNFFQNESFMLIPDKTGGQSEGELKYFMPLPVMPSIKVEF